MCIDDSDCLFWAFLDFAGSCELKANCNGGIYDDPDSVSGEKGCVAK